MDWLLVDEMGLDGKKNKIVYELDYECFPSFLCIDFMQ